MQSSTVAGVAFEAGHLYVKYRNGDVYQCEASAADHAYLMAAPSKGQHLALHFRNRLKRSNESGTVTLTPEPKLADPKARQLNMVENDLCCSPRLNKALFTGQLDGKECWTCPRCGTDWKAFPVDQVKHWRPVVFVEVFRMPGRS